MSILMVLIGAPIGAVIGSLFMHWRNDVAKERQHLESKTPYDYALTNAINERDRLQDELRTIHALKRTVEDTERIRNEINTILSYGGEEPTESVYGGLNGIPIVRHSDGTISPFPRWDGMTAEEAAWDAAAVSRAYQANVREDDAKDARLTEDDEERSSNHLLREAFNDTGYVDVLCMGGMVSGVLTTIGFEYGELTELQVNGMDINLPSLIEIRKGDDVIWRNIIPKRKSLNGRSTT